MEAILRDFSHHNWITYVMLFCFFLLFFLKTLNPTLLKGVAFSLFNKGFVELESEKNKALFSLFEMTLFLFSSLTISFVILIFKHQNSMANLMGLNSFFLVFLVVFSFLFVKSIVTFLLLHLFSLKSTLHIFFFANKMYFYNLSIVFYVLLIVYFYSFENSWFLGGFIVFFLVLRFVILFENNKNLISSELFYFILYLCALEIAPLLVLFKWMV